MQDVPSPHRDGCHLNWPQPWPFGGRSSKFLLSIHPLLSPTRPVGEAPVPGLRGEAPTRLCGSKRRRTPGALFRLSSPGS